MSPREQFRADRQRRQNFVFTLLAILMVIAAVLSLLVLAGRATLPGLSEFEKGSDYAESGDRPCLPEGAKAAPLESISVKVLNATGQPGLAGGISERLAAHGVKIEDPGNYVGQFYGTAQISAGPTHIVEAYTLARFFPDARVRFSESDSAFITVILGEHFSDMLSEEEITELLDAGIDLKGPQNCKEVKGL